MPATLWWFVAKPEKADALHDAEPEHLMSKHQLQIILDRHENVFQPLPAGLPPDCDVGHTIPLQLEPGHKPPFKQPYRPSPLELAEVENQVSELLCLGHIEPNKSPYGAPVLLFVKKKNGS